MIPILLKITLAVLTVFSLSGMNYYERRDSRGAVVGWFVAACLFLSLALVIRA